MKRILIFVFFVIFFIIFSSQSYYNLNCVIKFSNEQIYFIGKPIVIKFEIINKSFSNYFIQIANDISYNFSFIVISSDGEQVDYKDEFILKKKSIDKVFTKEIMLAPNESYAVEMDINEWFNLTKEGVYFIQGVFYPYIDSGERIVTQNILKLNSRQRKDWDEFFLYIDFDKFIMNYPSFRDKYKYASENARINLIEEFKKYIISTFYNDLLYFEIRKTLIEFENAKVDVYLEFSYKNYIEKYQAQYHLSLKDQIWLIKGYEITPVRK